MHFKLIPRSLIGIGLVLALSGVSPGIDESQPTFKGGQKNLTSFIFNALIYPEYSKENCLQGTIQVSFKLNKEGQIYDSKVLKGYGTDLDGEALRIVRLTSKKWVIPANYDTLASLVLPVNFTLRDLKCSQRSKDEIDEAIRAYRARIGLNDAIFNFYDKKLQGNYDVADEPRILALKSQLGYDDKYIERLFKQAQKKLKQGDREGACDDARTIRRLGSDLSASMITDCN